MQVTPMQELILQIQDEFPAIKELAQRLLDKEKEHMIDIWLDCVNTFHPENYDEENERYIACEYLENRYTYGK